MQPYMRRWPWWSPVRWLPAVALFGGLLYLSVVAARDALAEGLRWDLVMFGAGTVVASVALAVGRPRSRLGPLVFSLGGIVAAMGLAGLFESGLIWQGFVAFCVVIICIGAPVMFKVLWPLRMMTDDEAQAYLGQLRAWRRSRAHTPQSRLVRLIRRLLAR